MALDEDEFLEVSEITIEEAYKLMDENRISDAKTMIAAHAQMLALVERLITSLPRDLRDPLTLSTVEELTSAGMGSAGNPRRFSAGTRFTGSQNVCEKLAGLMEKDRER